MEREHIARNDFPSAHGTEGFDIDSVGAHLAAVAAHVAALEARITALETERETLRHQLAEAKAADPAPATGSGTDLTAGDEVAARLMVSKLAMDGKSRDTILMQLAVEHDVADPAALVDDVLAHLS
ncbi:MAG: hypothetical protein KDB48_05830 [Solirubrobacterales bacterium]|nr:hypothetical protein [Solirubrobacterales bacterium]HMT03940.1 hypothetical protein [Solirubrobacterales bacterium]